MINKISSVSFASQNRSVSNKNNKLTLKNYTVNNIIPNNTANLSLINFTGKEYYKTLEENYFKLPEGAEPDVFQKASAMNILKGNDVIVTAPTGTGKTAIALYAITNNMKDYNNTSLSELNSPENSVISKNMEDGMKTFYTTPLKALSNEKFRSFQKIYGEENVGLLTGDTKINSKAPIVVMTTEVYRNMVLSNKFNRNNPILDNLKTVVFDELHYLGDADRGGIWEQSIILSDPKTQLLALSATVGNNKDVANWMAVTKGYDKAEIVSSKDRDMNIYHARNNAPLHTVLIDVPSENRHVPLEFDIIQVQGENAKSLNKAKSNKKEKKADKKKDKQTAGTNETEKPSSTSSAIPTLQSYQKMVTKLKNEDKLPAIFFVFSKKSSKAILNHLAKFGEKLNSKEEQDEVKAIIKRYKDSGKYLGESLDERALEKGYAIHNAGLLPTQKELVEELFNHKKKLVKVIIATETLSAGINMPARTTVISSEKTPAGELTPNKFHQMAGRAGRRGIDDIGYCISMSVTKEQHDKFDELINSKPNDLESAFKPDFSFVVGYYDTCQNDELIKELFDKSFYAYDSNPQIRDKKSDDMMKIFSNRRMIMKKMEFIKSNHKLTPKGELLTKLNGYEQIPVINAIYNKKLANMTPVEFAAAVSVMANIEPKYESQYAKKDEAQERAFEHPNEALFDFVSDFNKDLKKYNYDIVQYDPEYKQVQINTKAAKHLFEWARLNSANDDSVENWKNLYNGNLKGTIRNEGSLFKEITMTADLLKQMKLIAKTGMEFSEDKADFQYYNKISHNIEAALALICRTPVDV